MPGISQTSEFSHITLTELHPTLGAELSGVYFSQPVAEDLFQEILAAITKYGVCVFRNTGLNYARHVAFAAQFGELDDVMPYLAGGRPRRLSHVRLFDVGNIDLDGGVFALGNVRREWKRGNSLFHVDSSFNPRRAGYSLLRAAELPPTGMGGETEFADSRTAVNESTSYMQDHLHTNDFIAAHSLWHSRKVASPSTFADVDPEDYPMSRHRLLQTHEASGRETLSGSLRGDVHRLFSNATQPRYALRVGWENTGDLMLWDNTSVMHQAVGGTFEGQYRRDMRRGD
ncbi:alpha-ketoglutarate-dependent 2-4-dichlorophenoxyacetate dioxygenase [Penicillium argentinense]|uniref:Alpha-ketoglutarate-dependent 2-4-dichlorophenoxyacetate dioxygenase n=1 Tax=Penicillium argentinense TaxID=1131581 RepID=A0A9W9KGE5_9EURO|nr:alpha-ketoglutarate-dependent 2-4-dichlorophenoxyacetate dioxygenase [Penicillium argentinense]KAJ5104177.1 alpha-ketoglutarate-dependent 2-4-dichlorophenoxyacetate dioxygenase [Penicillium argentinense]